MAHPLPRMRAERLVRVRCVKHANDAQYANVKKISQRLTFLT
jgi:hypothetical protein